MKSAEKVAFSLMGKTCGDCKHFSGVYGHRKPQTGLCRVKESTWGGNLLSSSRICNCFEPVTKMEETVRYVQDKYTRRLRESMKGTL